MNGHFQRGHAVGVGGATQARVVGRIRADTRLSMPSQTSAPSIRCSATYLTPELIVGLLWPVATIGLEEGIGVAEVEGF